ncbi:ABC transporter permease subunit [Sanguibacter sp. 25GB23B1]|uniref:amino acid ABC transporter permease n=1 Tax=unclassified Sanguibacter TaxID=2645534 RepID=UPI0032AE95B0
MSGSVLYDAPGPRARMLERWGSAIFGLVILGLLAWLVSSLAARGIFDDRWAVYTDPPKQQTAEDVWSSLLLTGLGATLRAAVVAAPLALVLALTLAILRTSTVTVVRRLAIAVIELLRGMPVLLMMLFGLLGFGLSSFQAVVFGLALYNAAIVAEILRAGLSALPRGQAEAGTALGLTRWQTLRMIQLPQVVRLMLPSLISQFVVLLKDSSLGFIIGYPELLSVMKNNYSFFGNDSRLPLFIAVVLIYLAVNLTLTRVAVFVEKRFSARGQKMKQVVVAGGAV